jgi:tRNA(Arg) A34 adenosine deaminase TadA
MTPIHEKDADHLRHAIELATRAHDRSNAPFGAILVGEDGRVLAAGSRPTEVLGPLLEEEAERVFEGSAG